VADIVQQRLSAARKKANAATRVYSRIYSSYVPIIKRVSGDCPESLGVAHLTVMNPGVDADPQYRFPYFRGFMASRIDAAAKYGYKDSDLVKPYDSAYVWCRYINEVALSIYTNNPDIFVRPKEDFWGTAYIAAFFGGIVFNKLWINRDQSKDSVFESILYGFTNSPLAIRPWTKVQLQEGLLNNCVTSVETAKRVGTLSSLGWGREPENNG
jgi:hypothetical protein